MEFFVKLVTAISRKLFSQKAPSYFWICLCRSRIIQLRCTNIMHKATRKNALIKKKHSKKKKKKKKKLIKMHKATQKNKTKQKILCFEMNKNLRKCTNKKLTIPLCLKQLSSCFDRLFFLLSSLVSKHIFKDHQGQSPWSAVGKGRKT